MNKLKLLATLTPDWIVNSFPIIRIVLVAITAVCAMCLIITTLMQSNNNEDGANALSGASQESYYAQNKFGGQYEIFADNMPQDVENYVDEIAKKYEQQNNLNKGQEINTLSC